MAIFFLEKVLYWPPLMGLRMEFQYPNTHIGDLITTVMGLSRVSDPQLRCIAFSFVDRIDTNVSRLDLMDLRDKNLNLIF